MFTTTVAKAQDDKKIESADVTAAQGVVEADKADLKANKATR